jgi:hypothetical protein
MCRRRTLFKEISAASEAEKKADRIKRTMMIMSKMTFGGIGIVIIDEKLLSWQENAFCGLFQKK